VKRAALLILILAAGGYLFARPPAGVGGMDFTAFYCASRTLASGANPYRYEPLHTCEHHNRSWRKPADVVAAPLPPYALALLVPVMALPYAQASLVWLLLLIASAAVIIWAIRELTNLPLLAVGVPIVIAVLLQSMPTGSLAPVPIALLCAAAVAITRRQWNLAALLLGLACIEPHVAVPAFIAAALLIAPMRARLGVAALALLAIAVVSGGIALNAQYFTAVLPAHARFELGSIVQFGLSSMLYNFGVPARIALAIGAAQYALFVLLGVGLAARYRRDVPAMLVLVPMAFAVIGGVYIHLTQLAAVLPLGFVVAGRKPSPLPWIGISLVAIPWNLLEAATPNALIVPRLGEIAPGEFAYVANALVYAGIGCILWALLK